MITGGMMMKYAYVLMMLLCVSAVAATTFDMQLLRYEPLPARPGDVVTVWLQLENTDQSPASNAQILIDQTYPFTPASADDRQINVGALSSNSEYVTSADIAVDRNAPPGTYDLRVRASDGASSQTFELPITISSGITSLAVTQVTSEPSQITPGGEVILSVRVQNLEDALLRDLTAKLDLTNVPLAPLQGTSQQKIASLDGREMATFRFSLIAEPEAQSNVYKVPLTLSFSSTEGANVTQEETLGIVVRAEPELSVIVDQTQIYTDHKEGTVLLRLVNKGLSQIKFAEATLSEGEGYELVGSSPTVYVGNIDSDDFETLEYTIKPSKDTFTLNVRVTYSDSLNNGYENDVQLPIKAQRPVTKPKTGLWILLIVVVLVVGYIIYRRNRKKR